MLPQVILLLEFSPAPGPYRASGFNMVYHHVGRDIVNLNVLVDQVARRARKDLQDSFKRAIVDLQADYPELPDDVDIYDFSNA